MGFGIRVQRMWKINLAGCSGPQKRDNTMFQTYFGPILGGSLPDLVLGGLEQGFRESVQSMGLE